MRILAEGQEKHAALVLLGHAVWFAYTGQALFQLCRQRLKSLFGNKAQDFLYRVFALIRIAISFF